MSAAHKLHRTGAASNALANDSERMKQEMGVVSGDLQSVCVCVSDGPRRLVLQPGINLRHKHKVDRDQ